MKYIQNAIPLSDQLYMLKEYKEELNRIVGEERTNYIISNSLFLVSCGNVDIGNTYFLVRKFTYDPNSYTSLLATWASSFLKVYMYLYLGLIAKSYLIVYPHAKNYL